MKIKCVVLFSVTLLSSIAYSDLAQFVKPEFKQIPFLKLNVRSQTVLVNERGSEEVFLRGTFKKPGWILRVAGQVAIDSESSEDSFEVKVKTLGKDSKIRIQAIGPNGEKLEEIWTIRKSRDQVLSYP